MFSVRPVLISSLALVVALATSACGTPCGGCGCAGTVYAPSPVVLEGPPPAVASTARSEVATSLPAPSPVVAAPVVRTVVVPPAPAAAPAPVVARAPATPATAAPKPGPARSQAFGKPGYAVFEQDGRLWVFPEGSKDLEEFVTTGEPAKRVTRLGEGPAGRTVMSSDLATLESYVALWPSPLPPEDPAARLGFVVFDEDGRYWVFRAGSSELSEFFEHGEPAKRVTRLGAGHDGRTIIAPDAEVVDAYLAAPTPQ